MRQGVTGAMLAACLLAAWTGLAQAAGITVGVTISTTGPAASLGIPQKNSIALLPTEIAGQKVRYVVLDDASDPTRAVANMRKLLSEENADVIIGSSTTPASLAMVEVAAEAEVPMITLAATARLVEPMDEKRKWVFKAPQNDSLMATAIADHMVKSGLRSVGFIGFADAYGDGWLAEITKALAARGISLAGAERYARADTSVTGQVLKLMAARPDAILIAGAGTPAALPQKSLRERGFKGLIYQTHGVANADFLRVGGKDVEGTILPAGPILVAAQLPDDNQVKAVALGYVNAYEAVNGPGSVATFGAHAYDAGIMLRNAVPSALKQAEPGSPAFHSALRDALESLHEVVLTHGVTTMSPTNHNGLDERARVMVTITNGAWTMLRQ